MLDDQDCACHADSCALINEYFPQVKTVEADYTFTSRRATSAGASSVMDMILAIMQDLSSQRDADLVDEIKRVHQPKKTQLDDVPLSSLGLTRPVPRPLNVAVSLMETHIEEPMEIDEIASHVGVSRRQLERRFARYLNAAPNRYYLELRLTRARQLIIQSNRSMTDVALATGFVSYPHFYKRFKDLFGLPPMTFRDNYYSSDIGSSERYAIAAGF
ncbi:helix-turn-helix domain-containing protein [Pseudomonas sp. CBSPBW29]|nr:helix-turn-helix domain-containing protein [Pseudomonas sp. CBSPBW29]WEL64561.1 helix-turn-helix domain-containing protein [Pseudomonas sp. CBSPGW29]WEL68032.1 helix-turn-helix domain-containing protein [Pseudomonas sp. CBSPCGW29]WEL75052.1 helix-turn-helix domain-containing protein [Pseudomonas sp. CBSPAW29]WEL80704.1 helix-turn-helix domain-containing protein [Pseudomonas sp. CBSPCAW29]WEL89223.1 helix-turn-helix domain-containing protein [Pseudomonas sp. CBSPCBW29]